MRETDLPLKVQPIYKTRAVVTNTKDDPLQVLRVQIRVPGWWDNVPDGDLPWAEYQLSDARARGGHFTPAEADDWVWVEFPDGDTRYPIIVGWCHYAPDKKPNTPHEAWNGDDKIIHKINATADEPDPSEPIYHGSDALEKYGVIIEINPDGELLITQREHGTAIRITKDGALTMHIEGNQHESVTGNSKKHVVGEVYLKHDGTLHFDGPKMDFGALGSLEPSVLGDKLAAAFSDLKAECDNHQHIGNLGAPVSPAMQVMPFEFSELLSGGNVYSTKNRNQ
ncbi:MAG: hypothetical protein IBX50_04190 [Marinospirillum sp.]|nr:hypothetical protein [Marinospirillum sp.]